MKSFHKFLTMVVFLSSSLPSIHLSLLPSVSFSLIVIEV